MVAAARAAATRRPQPVITDEFAEPLVRAVGIGPVHSAGRRRSWSPTSSRRVSDFPRMIDTFAARARFYDDYFAQATAAGVRQVVIVASGLDARAVPAFLAGGDDGVRNRPARGDRVQDRDAVPARRRARRRAPHGGHRPARRLAGRAARRPASIPPQPTAWLAEGVLIGFLPPEAEVRLLDNVISLSAAGSRFAADFGSLNPGSRRSREEQARIAAEGWRRQGLDLDIAGLAYPGRAHRRRRAPASPRVGSDSRPGSPICSPPPDCPSCGGRAPGPGRHDRLRAGCSG